MFSWPPTPHIEAAVTTARLPFKSITVVVAWSCCYKRRRRRRRTCDSDTSTQNRHCEMLQCRKCTHPWTQDRNKSEKQNSGKKPKQEAKKLLNNKIHPLPYQKKNHENPESFVWLSIHNCKRKPFEAGKIVWNLQKCVTSSSKNWKVALLQREAKRDRAALDTTVEGNPSQPKTKPPKFVQSSNLWDPKTKTLKVNLAMLQFSQTLKRKKGDQTEKTPSYDFTS